MSDLYDLYYQAAVEMKKVDPAIKTGPAFGGQRLDWYRGILSFASSRMSIIIIITTLLILYFQTSISSIITTIKPQD